MFPIIIKDLQDFEVTDKDKQVLQLLNLPKLFNKLSFHSFAHILINLSCFFCFFVVSFPTYWCWSESQFQQNISNNIPEHKKDWC